MASLRELIETSAQGGPGPDRPPTDAQYITLNSTVPTLAVEALRGAEPPTVTQMAGGWVEIPRPGREPVTTWVGGQSRRMTVPLLLDGWTARESVEAAARTLERMASAAAPGEDPPRVRVGGAVPVRGAVWVIASLDWGPSSWDPRGYRTRQQVTVELLEHSAATITIGEKTSPAKKASTRARGLAGAATRIVVARRGDTLQTIARRELGDAGKWRALATANGMRDPAAVREGQKVKLP